MNLSSCGLNLHNLNDRMLSIISPSLASFLLGFPLWVFQTFSRLQKVPILSPCPPLISAIPKHLPAFSREG